jgi:CBS domain-containing protein
MSQTVEVRVEDIMTKDVIAVYPTTSVAALVQLLLTHDIAGAPVVGEDGRPIGVVTCTDLLDPGRRSEARGEPRYLRLWHGDVCAVGIEEEERDGHGRPLAGVVGDIMSHEVIGVNRAVSVREAARIMARAGVHRLLVTDGKRACGLITAMDCLKALAGRA